MGYNFTSRIQGPAVLPIGVLLLLLFGSLAVADVVGTSGTISRVPGYEGKKLKYRAGAIRSAPGKAHFWLRLKNEESVDISVVVCAMLNLKRPEKQDEDFKIGKNLDEPPKWKCRSEPHPKGSPPNYHFGCKLVTVGAGQQIDVFDQVADFSKGGTDDFTDEELGRLYFDVLKACELTMCDQVKGGNRFLTPDDAGTQGEDPWVNVWAGGKKFEDLTSTGLSETDWPNGNWITMRKETPGLLYPSRLIGTLVGAPAGSTVQFFCTNDGGPRPLYQVQPDPSRPPCGGLNLHVNELFQIGIQPDEESGFRLWVPPTPGCGTVPEGSIVRFSGDVIAEPGASHYDPGEFMYGVDTWLVRDTQPPTIISGEAHQAGSRLHVSVAAEDATTMATGASIVYSVGGGPQTELPIGYAVPSSAGETMLFEEDVDGLPFAVPVRYHFSVVDELGNRASTAPDSVVLDPAAVKGPPPLEFALRVIGANPFHATEGATFEYGAPRPAAVSIAVFDANGRQVATLVDETVPPGRHTGSWRGPALERVESGVYFLRMEAGTFRAAKRIVLLK
jgi:hypothetical protein